jgi:hypothetical protein
MGRDVEFVVIGIVLPLVLLLILAAAWQYLL